MAHQPRWTMSQVTELFNKPLIDLLFEAQQIHRQHFDPRQVQVSTLLSIKTGACPEDCKYCPQSARYKTGLEAERLMEVEQVLESARQAKNAGSTRFCMGAAWKNPNDRDMPYLEQMVKGVKALGLESCMTLGTLTDSQAQRLAEAGLDYYNHNLDTSPEFYGNIITTRTYQERLDTLDKVRDAGIKVCSGGIVGLGESVKDRAGLLLQLANLPTPPESVTRRICCEVIKPLKCCRLLMVVSPKPTANSWPGCSTPISDCAAPMPSRTFIGGVFRAGITRTSFRPNRCCSSVSSARQPS